MPAHRSPSTTVRTQAQQRPYKVPVIVISSDEEEGPRPPPPKRNPRKHHKRAKPEPAEVVEISEEKHEHLDSERMQRRCHELEQERDKLQRDNRRLADQLKANAKQNTLSTSTLDEALSCEVCTHAMWTPYLLANCGHTFCQDCLTDWFNTTLSQHVQSGTRGMPAYTCPSCRHPVRFPPVQNFSLKRLVRLAAESRGESSPQRPQQPPPPPPPPVQQQSRGRGGGRRDYPVAPFMGFFGR